jgi:hypothetical protein
MQAAAYSERITINDQRALREAAGRLFNNWGLRLCSFCDSIRLFAEGTEGAASFSQQPQAPAVMMVSARRWTDFKRWKREATKAFPGR